MVGMGPLTVVARDLVDVAADNSRWMTWNLLLAVIPAALAVVVFRHRGPRTGLWWTGAALCALFLPNAPYVITDLVHLRGDVLRAGSDFAVIAGVLPVYAAFIGVGLLAYVLAVDEMGRYLTRVGLGRGRGTAELATHAVCALGVVLGRVARLTGFLRGDGSPGGPSRRQNSGGARPTGRCRPMRRCRSYPARCPTASSSPGARRPATERSPGPRWRGPTTLPAGQAWTGAGSSSRPAAWRSCSAPSTWPRVCGATGNGPRPRPRTRRPRRCRLRRPAGATTCPNRRTPRPATRRSATGASSSSTCTRI